MKFRTEQRRKFRFLVSSVIFFPHYPTLENHSCSREPPFFYFFMGCGASTSGDPNGSMGKLHSSIRWFDPTGELLIFVPRHRKTVQLTLFSLFAPLSTLLHYLTLTIFLPLPLPRYPLYFLPCWFINSWFHCSNKR